MCFVEKPQPVVSQTGCGTGQTTRREYQIIGAQLSSILREACKEAPVDADLTYIDKRIVLLQRAIEDTKRRIEIKNINAELVRANKVRFNHLRRMEKINKQMEDIKNNQKHQEKTFNEVQEARQFYYSQRNEQIGEKIKSCKDASLRAQNEMIERNEEEIKRKDELLAKLKEKRAKFVREQQERSRKRMEQCFNACQRQKLMEEAKQRERVFANMPEKEPTTKRLGRLGEITRTNSPHLVSLAVTRREQQSDFFRPQQRSASRSPSPTGHQTLLMKLKEKELKHKERYEAESALRKYNVLLRAEARKKTIEKQQQNYTALLEKRLRRNDEIIENLHRKLLSAESARKRGEERESTSGKALRRSLDEHNRRAAANDMRRRNEILAKNYRRWNERADRVINRLKMTLEADDESCLISLPP